MSAAPSSSGLVLMCTMCRMQAACTHGIWCLDDYSPFCTLKSPAPASVFWKKKNLPKSETLVTWAVVLKVSTAPAIADEAK